MSRDDSCDEDNVDYLPIQWMMFQIGCLIKESPEKTNRNIINLINHKYMKRLFLFNRKFMETSSCIFMLRKFGFSNMLVS